MQRQIMSKNNFQKIYEIDVNHKTKEKSGLKYLSWAWAWAEFKKINSEATYLVDLYDGKPFLSDKDLGYMVSTTVTVGELTIPMHLPVLDGANKAMKAEEYTYKTKYKDKECKAASMFDINTAIMRCLTKNLAMFGLGLYIYAGEDIPSVDDTPELMSKTNLDKLRLMFTEVTTEGSFCGEWSLGSLEELHASSFDNAVQYIKEQG